ncbi:MAG: hypothetical protein ACI92G_004502, partial [Candidatus Pelagisphaera sp.]
MSEKLPKVAADLRAAMSATMFAIGLASISAFPLHANTDLPIPEQAIEILSDYCLDCHDEGEMKGDLNLDFLSIDWSLEKNRKVWENVHLMANGGHMPPAKEKQPSDEERETILAWLDSSLLEHTPIGGTLPRRLNQAEYEATVRDLFNLTDFTLPVGFPRDTEFHGFNNVGEGLVLSPPLMEAYSKVAARIADEIFPPKKPTPKSTTRHAGPEDMVLSFSAATVRGDALLLASRAEQIMRSCTWPSRIEIMASGTYRVTVSTSQFRPISDEPMKLEFRARELTASDRSFTDTFRLLKEIEVSSESPESVTFEADLYEGQTLLLRWSNAELDHEFNNLADQMEVWFKRDPRFLAAWQKAVYPDGLTPRGKFTYLRGRNGWDVVTENLANPELDMSQAKMDTEMTQQLLKSMRGLGGGTYSTADAMCHYYFENGPALAVHGLTVEGPLKTVENPTDIRRRETRAQMLGERKPGQSDEALARQMLKRFLPKAFRRPVDKQTIDTFLKIAKQHWAKGTSFEDGIHLLLRNILISPRFLYRVVGPNEMDDYDLAARLSYFLTQSPPDAKLRKLAKAGKLSNPDVLRNQARRLMPDSPSHPMIQSFTGQWLDTKLLNDIMPDPKLKFSEGDINIAKAEVEWFFTEILKENLPLTDFIDPDFTYSTVGFAQKIYEYQDPNPKPKMDDYRVDIRGLQLERIPLARGGRYGGLMAQSAIMTATANGVDTQPVLRGVWMLENILGTPPPPPPKSVPALTPDIRGTTNPKEMLAAHMADGACATCHKQIDPIGFMLENFDPVGRWRENWPKIDVPIQSSGTLPDGTVIHDVTDFKAWLVDNIDLFSQCLSEKLLTYATGRVPNYAEKKEIETIVLENHKNGNGF